MSSVSVISALFNEEECVVPFYQQVSSALSGEETWEIVLVDDGSSDRTWQRISELAREDGRVKGARFSRNFGQHVALTAGIDRSRGDYIVLMDADLQDRPEEIPRMLERARAGFPIVYARRRSRQESFLKRTGSRLFYSVFNALGSLALPPDVGIFRVLERRVVDQLIQLREQTRMLTGLIDWLGFEATFVDCDRPSREIGQSKYNLRKMLRLAINGLTSFSVVPLRFATFAGLIVSFISFCLGATFVYQKLVFGTGILGWPSLITSIFFLGGVQIFMIGVLGEYIGKIFLEVKNRPLYVVSESVGFHLDG